MPDGKRLWRTASGDLVEDGHADAVVLAYGIDDELAAEDANNVRSASKPSGQHTSKPKSRPTPKPKG